MRKKIKAVRDRVAKEAADLNEAVTRHRNEMIAKKTARAFITEHGSDSKGDHP